MNIQGVETDLLADDINILVRSENGKILNWKVNRILKELANTWFHARHLVIITGGGEEKKNLFVLGIIKVL